MSQLFTNAGASGLRRWAERARSSDDLRALTVRETSCALVYVPVEVGEGLLDSGVGGVVAEVRPNWDECSIGVLDEVAMSPDWRLGVSATDARHRQQNRNQQARTSRRNQ
jgi:hypothetical protein